jgi:hypothetical protein
MVVRYHPTAHTKVACSQLPFRSTVSEAFAKGCSSYSEYSEFSTDSFWSFLYISGQSAHFFCQLRITLPAKAFRPPFFVPHVEASSNLIPCSSSPSVITLILRLRSQFPSIDSRLKAQKHGSELSHVISLEIKKNRFALCQHSTGIYDADMTCVWCQKSYLDSTNSSWS